MLFEMDRNLGRSVWISFLLRYRYRILGWYSSSLPDHHCNECRVLVHETQKIEIREQIPVLIEICG